jgi:hypothetical protein
MGHLTWLRLVKLPVRRLLSPDILLLCADQFRPIAFLRLQLYPAFGNNGTLQDAGAESCIVLVPFAHNTYTP